VGPPRMPALKAGEARCTRQNARAGLVALSDGRRIDGVGTAPAPARVAVRLGHVLVVQERRRFYRESMTVCLRRQLDGIEVVDGVVDAPALLALAGSCALGHAVIEADMVPWDVVALAAELGQKCPPVQLIGLSGAARPSSAHGFVVLSRSATPEQLASLVQPGRDRAVPFLLRAGEGDGKGPLTAQQLRVLALLSLGLTVAEVATRLGLSERGAAKSKAAIFAKLGVQSQAQAVAAALAAGLLGPPGRPPPTT
jgi:DNA-binding NarL/FixJ family response regulator